MGLRDNAHREIAHPLTLADVEPGAGRSSRWFYHRSGVTKMRSSSSHGIMLNLTQLRGICLAHSRPRRALVLAVRRQHLHFGSNMGHVTLGVMGSGPRRSLRWHL